MLDWNHWEPQGEATEKRILRRIAGKAEWIVESQQIWNKDISRMDQNKLVNILQDSDPTFKKKAKKLRRGSDKV